MLGGAAPESRALAVLPGAFNPPTLAHVELARAARGRGFDVLFSLSTHTIDKQDSPGLTLEERLHLLAEMAAAGDRFGVVLQNRGLYAEQAEALRRSFPAVETLAFVVGMDKVGQIFAPRYYADLEDSLAALFGHARLLVAARAELDRSHLSRLLEREPARRFADRIEWLELDPRWREVSATAVRKRLARGDTPAEWLPEPVERYLRRRGPIFTS